jgi:tRNA threonylcarbamoyladenosine biosynthesis protein TsaB
MTPVTPCLVLDGSARDGVRVGVLSAGAWKSQSCSEEGAMESADRCVREALAAAGVSVDDIASFAVCAGPGSILGIRLTSVMVRAWLSLRSRPCYVWNALEAVASSARLSGRRPPFVVASESRLRRWNVLKVPASGPSECAELEAAQVAALGAPLIASSAGAPFPCEPAPDVWPSLPGLFSQGGLLRAEDRPDALNPAPEFALWSGERHRAP